MRRDFQQPLGGVGAAVENHVLDPFPQFQRDFLVNRQLAGVDDAHGHPGVDGVIQEHRMNRLAHRVVAPEREGHVGHPAGHQRVRQFGFNAPRGFDEIHRVVVVFGDAGGDGEDVGIENDVLRRKTDLLGENPVGALADGELARLGVGLTLLVERHDDGRRAVAANQPRLPDKLGLAFLHADGIHHWLALDALEGRFQNLPLGRVNHHRNPADVRLGGDEVEERDHRLLRVQHPLVHVDVNDLRAVLDLLAGNVECGVVVAGLDQPLEHRRTGDVGALADVDEQRVRADVQRLQPGQPAARFDRRYFARRQIFHRLGDGADVGGRGAAATADDVEKTAVGELADHCRHLFGRLVVFAEGIRQAGVGMGGNVGVGDAGQFGDVGPQLRRAQRAVQPEGQRADVRERIPERLGGLAGQGAPRGVGNRAGNHHRQADARIVKKPLDGEQRRLGIQRVEDGFHQQNIHATLDQALRRLGIGGDQFVEVDVAKAGVVDIRRQAGGAVGGTENASDEARPVGCAVVIGHCTGQPRRRPVQFRDQGFHAVVVHGNRSGIEGIGLDEVRAGLQIGGVNLADDRRLGQRQQIVVALEIAGPVAEAFAPVVGFLQAVALDHGAHRAVQDQDAAGQEVGQFSGAINGHQRSSR